MEDEPKRDEKGRWLPGQAGGGRRPGVPSDLFDLRKHYKDIIERELYEISDKTMTELIDITKDKNATGLRVLLASVLLHGVKTGDQARLGFLLDRLIGKVKENVEITGSMTTRHETVVALIHQIEQD